MRNCSGGCQRTAFAIIQCTDNALDGFFDPNKKPHATQEAQPNTRLVWWESKELCPTTQPKSKPMPLTRLAPVTCLVRPVVAYTDFNPEFYHKPTDLGKKNKQFLEFKSWKTEHDAPYAYLFVRPRSMWAQVFLCNARRNLEGDKHFNGVELVGTDSRDSRDSNSAKETNAATNTKRKASQAEGKSKGKGPKRKKK